MKLTTERRTELAKRAEREDIKFLTVRCEDLLALLADLEEAESLSVKSILLDIVPGDGNGLELYAGSVDSVVDRLTDLAEENEVLEMRLAAVTKHDHQAVTIQGGSHKPLYDSAALEAARQEERKAHAVGLDMVKALRDDNAALRAKLAVATEALEYAGQCLSWQCRGECRGFNAPIIGHNEAIDMAKEALSKIKEKCDAII